MKLQQESLQVLYCSVCLSLWSESLCLFHLRTDLLHVPFFLTYFQWNDPSVAILGSLRWLWLVLNDLNFVVLALRLALKAALYKHHVTLPMWLLVSKLWVNDQSVVCCGQGPFLLRQRYHRRNGLAGSSSITILELLQLSEVAARVEKLPVGLPFPLVFRDFGSHLAN